jgi:hypothetical protein
MTQSSGRTAAKPPLETGRVLLTGWFSFLHGEATAGDLLALTAMRQELDQAGIAYDTAWSPSFRPRGPSLDAVRPGNYSHLIFVCGPLHGDPITELHARFAHCRRIAVGVTVLDPRDPAAAGFDLVIPRDAPGSAPQLDLSAGPAGAAPSVPVVGVAISSGQGEYGDSRRHERVNERLAAWLGEAELCAVPLDTRLDRHDWRLAREPIQFISLLRRLDAVVTTRLHGLAIGLANGVPVLAVDPIAGGGKVSAQAAAWHWPILLPEDRCEPSELDAALADCLSPAGLERARSRAAQTPADVSSPQLAVMRQRVPELYDTRR